MSRLIPSIDRTIDHGLVLKFYDSDSPGFQAVFEYVVDPKDQPDFLRDLANAVTTNLKEVATNYLQGDCETCKNVRLVDVELPSGRKTNAHCPDCSSGHPAPFDGYPIVGGGLAPRQSE